MAYGKELGIRVFPISAVSGKGVTELLYEVRNLLETSAPQKVYYEQEFFPETELAGENLAYTIELETGRDGGKVYAIEGPSVERMLNYTNLASEKGFRYFTAWLKRTGIQDDLRSRGIAEGDTVRLYNQQFEYYEDTENRSEDDE
jgi:GTP-binding protein